MMVNVTSRYVKKPVSYLKKTPGQCEKLLILLFRH